MSRIDACFNALKQQQKKALVPYFVAGDPDLALTLKLMHELVAAGVDIIELGVPFSDPMAEGPTIQLAHERALLNNVSLTDTLNLVAKFRETNSETPVVLMGYANPVEVMGYQAFAEKAQQVGLDGVLIVDLPPEEAVELKQALTAVAVDIICLIAPTTSEARIKKIVDVATGYLYYVSLKGVTGSGALDIDSVKQQVALIESHTELPICVGFGIKDANSCQKIAELADGAVVGSALVDRIASAKDNQQAINEAVSFTQTLRHAMDVNKQ